MKKILVLMAILLLAWAGTSWAATIGNTKHDLSSTSTASVKASTQGEICIFCHTPHKASPAGGRPVWNHTLDAGTALTWNPTATVRGTTLPIIATDSKLGSSIACLSCHLGTMALGDVLVYYSGTSSAATNFAIAASSKVTANKLNSTSSAYIDPANMSKNHPVGVAKPANVAGYTNFKATPTAPIKYYPDSTGAGEYVGCPSCHNPHDNTTAPFLKTSNAASALCISCHDL